MLVEGTIKAGMAIRLAARPHPEFPVAWVAEVMKHRQDRPEDAAALAACEALCPEWRRRLAGVRRLA